MATASNEVDGVFPVVGLGASAGGLAPLRTFFRALPKGTGCAYVVVQHLSPSHQSHLAEILSREASIPVQEITNDLVLEPDHAYVISPDQALVVDEGKLRIRPAGPRPHHPVDTLFETLGRERGELAVGIILSGTGSNGTAGARALKACGGAIFVQTPATAEHGGMPRSVITSGIADRILDADAMPEEVLAFLRERRNLTKQADDGEASGLEGILSVIRVRSGQDFRSYKTTTLSRRIQRRMGLRHLQAMDAYAELLRNDPQELDALSRDLLINVTAFFRDEESWNVLQRLTVEPLVERTEFGGEVRAWTPGCATGEEAYSLAMLLLEAADEKKRAHTIKVFATDPADDALARARQGLFPGAVAEAMPPERLERFFEQRGDAYIAKAPLRESIVFAPQNLLSDPPFSQLDIICCRNLLIYLKPDAQDRVLSLLHFALRDGGTLFLGSAEAADQAELFEPVAKEHRIYRRIGPTRPTRFEMPDMGRVGPRHLPQHESAGEEPATAHNAWRTLAEHFAPPSALVDRDFRVQHLHGDTGPYLTLPPGGLTDDLVQLARPKLSARLRATGERAFRAGEPMSFETRLEDDTLVRTTLQPVRSRRGADVDRLLVSFEKQGEADPAAPPAPSAAISEDELEEALRLSREELRGTVEELQRSNQELQAANEEVSSINEEFQATNEELETSKEELQSLNEELNTVNIQLQNKVEELERRTNDLDNLLSSSDIATLFLDEHMKIRWFTPAMRELLSLEQSDIGRPVTDLARRFTDEAFVSDMRGVLKDLQPRAAEVAADGERWFMRRVLPYRTDSNRIAGVVATFVDISERRHAEEHVLRSEARFRALINASASIVWTTTPEGEFKEDSQTWRSYTGQSADDWLAGKWTDAVHPEDREFARDAWACAISEEEPLDVEFRLWCQKNDDWCHTAVRAVPLFDTEGRLVEWVGMNIDVTEERRADRRQQVLLDELQHRVQNLFASIAAIISLSKDKADGVEAFAATLQERLSSLSRTQDLLSQRADGDVELRGLIEAEIDAHGREGRITLDGPRLMVSHRKAQALGMALHELITNAVKYGALSVADAKVKVTWARLGDTEPRLVFSWHETGLTIEEPPVRSGFGSELLTEAVPFMIGGTCDLRFENTGVRCVIDAPLSAHE